VYTGYSRKTKQLYSLAWFRDGEASLPWGNIYHYLSKQFYLYFGNGDANYGNFKGKAAYVRLTIGPGAFTLRDDDIFQENDIYNW